MDIEDLAPEDTRLYHMCLKDYWHEAGACIDRREEWYARERGHGLRVKVARDDDGAVAGMIQYQPIERSFVEGEGLYVVLCIWVHGYKQGIGDRRGKGMGPALLFAAEEDARDLGAKGMAAWGIAADEWMNAPWFERHGYKVADKVGVNVLLWKPFAEDARPPRWLREHKHPRPVPGKVLLTSLNSGWCVSANVLRDTARIAAADFNGDVVFHEVDTSDRVKMLDWGNSDALYIDEERVDVGEPPTLDQLKHMLAQRVRRL
jgi:GNAT superfamily N-acetyltransferase